MAAGSLEVHSIMSEPGPCAIARHVTVYIDSAVRMMHDIMQFLNVARRLTRVKIVFAQTTEEYIVALAQLPQLTELTMHSYSDRWIGLKPLVVARSLTSLSIKTYSPAHGALSETEVDEVRALSHLHTINIPCLNYNIENMRRVLAQPHALEWQAIGSIPSQQIAQLIPALPSVTCLSGSSTCFSGNIMRALPRLTRLEVIGTAGLEGILDGCTHLTHLIIIPMHEQSLEYVPLVAHYSHIRSLTIHAFCYRYGLRTQDLHIFSHVQHIHELVLDMDDCEPDVWESAELAALHPPSALLPNLQKLTLF
jgi:hypothetical protein